MGHLATVLTEVNMFRVPKHNNSYRKLIILTNIQIRGIELYIHSGVRVTRSLVLYVCFVDRCLSFCTFSYGHCVVCSSPIYGF